MDKEKLLEYFLAEDYFLDHWIVQLALDTGIKSTTLKRMEKRQKWVQSEITKLEKPIK